MRLQFSGVATAVLAWALPISALADLPGYVSLSVNSTYSLDTATVGTSGGDIQWDGSSIIPLGTATVANIGVVALGSPALVSETLGGRFTAVFSATPITASMLANGDVILVHTNGGNYGWVQVYAVSNISMTLASYTFGATPASPQITQVQNNYYYLSGSAASMPIAPGSLFVIGGGGLADPAAQAVLQDATKGLPLTLNGASVSVTVSGVTTQPALYYAIASQLAAVLPSNTPLGLGTITVTYGGHSAIAPIQVAPTSLGIATMSGSGAGQAIATDTDYNLVTYTHAAVPGKAITFWGSGLGASPGTSDVTYSGTAAPIAVPDYPLQIYIGGLPTTILYQGRSAYPGLDQINVTVPLNVPVGCFVSVAMVSGSGTKQVEGNYVTIPVDGSGGNCEDLTSPISASQATLWSGKASVNVGVLGLELQYVSATDQGYVPTAAFSVVPGSALMPIVLQVPSSVGPISTGSCTGTPPGWLVLGSSGGVGPFPGAMDAGVIQLSALGHYEWLYEYFIPPATLYYAGEPVSPSFIPATGTTFVFTGAGGYNVGPFTATLNTVVSPTFTNLDSLATVTRSQGMTITWSGGSAGAVQVQGSGFSCSASVSDGQLTVPPYILFTVPPGSSSIDVTLLPYAQFFSARGLDVGNVFITPVSPGTVPVTYQ